MPAVATLWLFMRENWLSNRIFKSYDGIVAHCCDAWRKLKSQQWRIMSIGRRQWANGFWSARIRINGFSETLWTGLSDRPDIVTPSRAFVFATSTEQGGEGIVALSCALAFKTSMPAPALGTLANRSALIVSPDPDEGATVSAAKMFIWICKFPRSLPHERPGPF